MNLHTRGGLGTQHGDAATLSSLDGEDERKERASARNGRERRWPSRHKSPSSPNEAATTFRAYRRGRAEGRACAEEDDDGPSCSPPSHQMAAVASARHHTAANPEAPPRIEETAPVATLDGRARGPPHAAPASAATAPERTRRRGLRFDRGLRYFVRPRTEKTRWISSKG